MEYRYETRRRLPTRIVFNAIFFSIVIFTNTCVAQLEFKWLFGPWSPCKHTSCGPGGRKYREVWCIYTQTGHRVPDHYCQPDFKPAGGGECNMPCTENIILNPDQRETNYGSRSPEYSDYDNDWKPFRGETKSQNETDIQKGRLGFPVTPAVASEVEWVIDQWSSCRLVPGAKTCGRNSGIQYRNVTCERKDRQGRASSSRCQVEEPMPVTSQACELLCKQNCVVSAYSEWSGCDSTCQLSNQTRTRHVIVPPRNRGSHCPELSEISICENCTLSYTYMFSDWLPCTSFGEPYLSGSRAHYLIGYQSREITCLQSKGLLTSLRFCSDRFPHTQLQKHRVCVIPQDCQVSAWSAMRPHNTSCFGYDGQINHGYMIRTRQVLQLPLGDGQPCPSKLVDYIKLNKEDPIQLRPCRRAKWIMSSWSQCQSVPGYNHCGTGIQSRRAVCVEAGDDGTERPVGEIRCPQPKPLMAQPCTSVCGWDCSVSQWSVWSTCQDVDCNKPNVRRRHSDGKTGQTFRTRETLTLPGPGGKACPHLSETRMCEPEPCYTWNATFDPCEATTRGGCGDGTQLKKALCLNRAGVKVRERFCHESLHSEQNWANCYVPCPEDCILSEWGQWSMCPDPCMVQAGVKSMRSRQRQILAYHGPGRTSHPCPSASELRQTELCPVMYDCSTYQWETSIWGQCQLNIDNPNVHCGPGMQTRTVECSTTKGISAAVNKCMEKVKPKVSQSCIVECPIDCHVTDWSGWSDCGVTCLPVQARQIYPTQARRRFILQYPHNGGLSCPSDLREEQSCFGLPVCQTYYWKFTDWSDCVLPPVAPLCGQGLKARNITCYYADDQSTKQMSIITCLEKLGSVPDLTELCYIHCETECHFSPWSQWTACGPHCEKTRFRFRRLLDASKNNTECRDTELHPRDEHEECVCDNLHPALIGGWSDCIIPSHDEEDIKFASMSLTSISARYRRTNESGVVGLGPQIYCGAGKRYMAISCQKAELGVVGAYICTGEEYQEENCTIPCPVDCQTTEWSSWNSCSATCGGGVQQRERRIMALPENGGRKCPSYGQDKEVQTKVCTVQCSYHIWRMEDWGPCVPSEAKACGEGTHSRTVRCVSIGSEGSEMTVDESYCSSKDAPQAVKLCSLPCPGECVMSEWSDWSLCRQPCNGKQTQSQYRHVLRMPSNYAFSDTCFSQREERPCERGLNCIEYSWELSDWTSCLVNGGGTECGVGHKERYALCKNESGEIVESYRCHELFGHVSEPMVVSCEKPCDNDCLLSDWSDWSTCSTTCGLGLTKRRCSVLQNPIGNGRKCPEKLEQTKPCFHKGCYTWFVSEWSHCIIPKGVCGSGIKVRNVSCLNDEGRPVSFSRCPIDPEIVIMQTSHPCLVPCPGECKLSEWSSWSDCFISCEDFKQGYTVGIQARSRALLAYPALSSPACQDTPWEERMCDAQKCSIFTWITSSWDMKTLTREVFCVGDDGVRVTGGCDENNTPPHILTCTDPICLSPATCVDINICSCASDEGFEQFITPTSVTCVNAQSFSRGCDENNTPPHILTCTDPICLSPATCVDINICSCASDEGFEQFITPTSVTCVMNKTIMVDTAAPGAGTAKTANIWMYAVIAVGTLIVIAITAALYNMCELFRMGPRPRRKEDSTREPSTVGTFHSPEVMHENGKENLATENVRTENLCKQISQQDHVGKVVSAERIILSSPPGSCHPKIFPLSSNPDDFSHIDVATSTPESSSLTTLTTPLTPVNSVYVSNRLACARNLRDGIRPGSSNHMTSLQLKHNRRFKRIHYILPARIVRCFACCDHSSMCMLDELNADNEIAKLEGIQDQILSLTGAGSQEKKYDQDLYTNSSSEFLNHNCILSQVHDLRPSNRALPKHETNINLTETSKNCSTSVSGKTIKSSIFATVFSASAGQNLSCRTTSYESLDRTSVRHDETSQCSLQLGDTAETLAHHNISCEKSLPRVLHQQNVQRQNHFIPATKLVTMPTSLPYAVEQELKKEGSIFPSIQSSTNSSHCPVETNITNMQMLQDVTHLNTSDMDLSYSNELSFFPFHAHLSFFSSHYANDVTNSSFLHSCPKHNQNIQQTQKSKIILSTSPRSCPYDSLYNVQRDHQNVCTNHDHKMQPLMPSVKCLISSISQERDELVGRNTISPIATSTSLSSTSPSENLNNHFNETVSPALEKISQDSGHSTMLLSQTLSPVEHCKDISNITGNDRCSGLCSLYIPDSLESTRSPHSSSGRHVNCADVRLHLVETPDSAPQPASNGMETSV